MVWSAKVVYVQLNNVVKFADYISSDYQGAGFVFITPFRRVLILQKPNTKWCFVGGKKEKKETPLQTAKRETKEEIGFFPKGTIIDYFKHTKADEKVNVYSFIMEVQNIFEPKLNSEHIGYKWVLIKSLDEYQFSPGVVKLIPILQHLYK